MTKAEYQHPAPEEDAPRTCPVCNERETTRSMCRPRARNANPIRRKKTSRTRRSGKTRPSAKK